MGARYSTSYGQATTKCGAAPSLDASSLPARRPHLPRRASWELLFTRPRATYVVRLGGRGCFAVSAFLGRQMIGWRGGIECGGETLRLLLIVAFRLHDIDWLFAFRYLISPIADFVAVVAVLVDGEAIVVRRHVLLLQFDHCPERLREFL